MLPGRDHRPVAVNATEIEIRRLALADLDELRRVRLEALRTEPLAYGTTFEHEQAQPEKMWNGWLESSPPFGAIHQDRLIGMAGFYRSTAPNLGHRGTLGAMYVEARHRGDGTAARIVEAVLDHARGLGVEQVHLTVTAGNDRARRFYERLGFATYGIEPRGMKYAGAYHDLILMAQILVP